MRLHLFVLLLAGCAQKITFDPGGDGASSADGATGDGSTLPGADAGSSGAFTTMTANCPALDAGGAYINIPIPGKKATDLVGATALYHIPQDARLFGPVGIRLGDNAIEAYCPAGGDYVVLAIPK